MLRGHEFNPRLREVLGKRRVKLGNEDHNNQLRKMTE